MKTLILGASDNPERYSYQAAALLNQKGFEFVLVGRRTGMLFGVPIQKHFPEPGSIHTLTLYVGPQHQSEFAEEIVKLKPERVIFNPGTENPVLQRQLDEAGIPWQESCTLVLLSTGQY